MITWIERINSALWGGPVFILILVTGIYIALRTGFIQIRWMPKAVLHFVKSIKRTNNSGISGYRALCTALAATVGTGNLAGVAGAIAVGGPGAVFWMWVCGILGMGIKFAEIVLAMTYRQKNVLGEWVGGPMYMIQNGMPEKWSTLATVYCFFGVIASFGIGNGTQVNAVMGGIDSILKITNVTLSPCGHIIIGIFMAIIVWFATRNGASRIGCVTEKLIPFAAIMYILLGSVALILRWNRLPYALSSIIYGAFSPKAVTGGIIASVFRTIRVGAARGLFTNEAGMGTAAIAHASADEKDPVKQGLLGIIEVFLDTIVICTLTALVILCSETPITYGEDIGIRLTMDAFSSIYGRWVLLPVTLAVCLFAFATILGWGLYGARCTQYIFGDSAWKTYTVVQISMIILGTVINTSTMWLISELVNGLMVIPNLIAVAYLLPIFLKKLIAHKP